jgi:hypothetical protein
MKGAADEILAFRFSFDFHMTYLLMTTLDGHHHRPALNERSRKSLLENHLRACASFLQHLIFNEQTEH